jgi:hypothetical protein
MIVWINGLEEWSLNFDVERTGCIYIGHPALLLPRGNFARW